MNQSLKILFTASEVFPFSKTGGLSDVAGSLPKALTALGHDVRVVTPFYKSVKNSLFAKNIKKRGRIKNKISGAILGFNLFEYTDNGLSIYFVEKDKYFNRDGFYGTKFGDYPDNAARFGFFGRACLAIAEYLDFKPDIIHLNDWHTGLIPFYLKFCLPSLDTIAHFSCTRTLFTIHNMAYQGIFDRRDLSRLGIGPEFFNMQNLEFYGKINFLKSGILYSDAVSTVSRRYAEEIKTPEYGAGLDGLIKQKQANLYGVLNGVDYSEWNPANDKFIKIKYDENTIENKNICKNDLIEQMNLTTLSDEPIVGCVSRLVHQKGIDILIEAIDEIMQMGCSLVLLGAGDEWCNKKFKEYIEKYPGKINIHVGFNEGLAYKIEAGSDIYVMPSRFEPCGLNQMYSLKYGTVPVVRATGGLDDVVIDAGMDKAKGNGFKFRQAEKSEFLASLKEAVNCYKKKKAEWRGIILRGMAEDHSWQRSALEYVGIYKKILTNGNKETWINHRRFNNAG
ncbi:ADP-glucose type glycogen/starch synthase [Candidatus Omnitrophus magneticus]|uniref:Glycogen synthase n=1 Tax=Candidatus Omnitrophus magneticus TaxID=1609969 RepID=A0A0F0CPQ1_9BACT|nr:ADP-glucose type glycogen/starch synthase [Candidatus Omnitrophus magneticus]